MSSTVIEFNASYSIFTSVFANMNLNLVDAMAIATAVADVDAGNSSTNGSM